MLPEHCRIGTESSISKFIFNPHMQFAGNKYSSGKHTCIDQNGETDSIKFLPVF